MVRPTLFRVGTPVAELAMAAVDRSSGPGNDEDGLDIAGQVVRLGDRRGPAPATINRRVAAVRELSEYAVITVPAPTILVPPGRHSTGLRAPRRVMLGHLGSRRP
jgi:hypothetical protein